MISRPSWRKRIVLCHNWYIPKLSNDREKCYRIKVELRWIKPKLLEDTVDKLEDCKVHRNSLLHLIYVLLKSWIPQNSASLIWDKFGGAGLLPASSRAFDQSRRCLCVLQLLSSVTSASACEVMTEAADRAILGNLNSIKYTRYVSWRSCRMLMGEGRTSLPVASPYLTF